MKKICGAVLICLSVILWAVPGCIRTIGGCRYGKIPIEQGNVTVVSVDKVYEGTRELMKLSVKGLFVRDFYLTPAEYGKCSAGRGFAVGSKLTGTVVPGGPCPPMYYLEECR